MPSGMRMNMDKDPAQLIRTTNRPVDRTLIVGQGEVGTALAAVLKKHHQVFMRGQADFKLLGVDVMHICFPVQGPGFYIAVKNYMAEYKPKLTIIESTLPVGGTRSFFYDGEVVHSPIRGKHPDLTAGLVAYKKFVGAFNEAAYQKARLHFESAGIQVFPRMVSPETTEMGKILETTNYGVQIALYNEMKRICGEIQHVDYETAVNDFSRTYNQGMEKLGTTKYIKPLLEPNVGGLGGHCVYENAQMMKGQGWIFDTVMNLGKKQ